MAAILNAEVTSGIARSHIERRDNPSKKSGECCALSAIECPEDRVFAGDEIPEGEIHTLSARSGEVDAN
jgi:hypothetical protein